MKYKTIPNTDLNVSVITLGTWALGGDMWNGADDDTSVGAVQAALDEGINMIDTAPAYGNGRSEVVIGKAIAGRREKVVLATKCGIVQKGKRIGIDLSPASIQKEIDDSRRRLQSDYIDVYQCHWPDPNTSIEKTLETLLKLKERKVIRYIGVSNFDAALLKKAHDFTPIVTLQPQYSLLDRTIEKDVLPMCRDRQIGVMSYGSMAGGILSGKYQEEPNFSKKDARSMFYRYYKGEAFQKVQAFVERLKIFDQPLNQVAINWVRQQEGIVSVLVGCRNAQQVQDNVAAVNWKLSQEQLEQMKYE